MATEIVQNAVGKINDCIEFLKKKYEDEGYITRIMPVFGENGEGQSLCVTNATNSMKATFGLTTFAQVVFLPRHNDVEVLDAPPRISSNRATATWVAALSGGPGFPLLITSGIGAIRQKKLRKRLFSDSLAYLQQ